MGCVTAAGCASPRGGDATEFVELGRIESISYIPDPYTTIVVKGRHYNLRLIQSGFAVGDLVHLELTKSWIFRELQLCNAFRCAYLNLPGSAYNLRANERKFFNDHREGLK